MLSLLDMIGDISKAVEDYQIANDCTEEEAIDALVDKITKAT